MFVPLGTEEARKRRRFPFVTMLIVLANVAVFLYQTSILLQEGEGALEDFIVAYAVIPSALLSGHDVAIPYYLTPLTSMFVHGGLAHVGFNMLYLIAFGDNVEDRLGHIPYIFFYLLSGLAASAAHIAVNPESIVPSVGASGAIAGVLAGYLLLFPRGQVRTFVFIGFLLTITRVPALLFIGIWFVTQFFAGIGSLGINTAQTGGVAYWAHIGGFVAGFLLAALFRPSAGGRARR